MSPSDNFQNQVTLDDKEFFRRDSGFLVSSNPSNQTLIVMAKGHIKEAEKRKSHHHGG
jgi:hypothetical protein